MCFQRQTTISIKGFTPLEIFKISSKKKFLTGFTLLEVLITTVIITVGVAILVGLFGNVLVASSDAENTLIAMNLAQQRIEEIRNLAFANIADESKADVSGFSGFQREAALTALAVDPDMSDLKQVTVTVYWTFKGEEVSISLATYVSRN